MHPLAAIGLVFLAVLAWMGTILTLLAAVAQSRSRRPADDKHAVQSVETQSSAERAAQT